MVSLDKGLASLFAKEIEKPHLIKVKCQAHRIETVLKHAYKKCDNCPKVSSFIHSVYAFYSRSPKRKDDLRKYLLKHKKDSFIPRKLQDTRWVASHFKAAQVIYANYDSLHGHLKSLLTSPLFKDDKSTKDIARYLLTSMEHRHFLTTLTLILDVQYIFKGMSELYQTKNRSIIGQLDKKKPIIAKIDEIKEKKGGTYITEVLSQTSCKRVRTALDATATACESLSKYENSQSVKKNQINLNGNQDIAVPIDDDEDDASHVQVYFEKGVYAAVEIDSIVDVIDEKIKPLSTFMDKYLDAVKAQVRAYFPHDNLLKVMVSLDQTLWPMKVERILLNAEVTNLWKQWPQLFGFDDESEEVKSIGSDMEKLIQWLRNNTDFWCGHHSSQPDEFWQQVLQNFKEMPPNLAKILKSTLAIPLSGADVERSFSGKAPNCQSFVSSVHNNDVYCCFQ